MSIQSINPKNDEVLKTYDAMDKAQINAALAKAEEAYRMHRETPFKQRAEKIISIGLYLDEHADELGALITDEMGKPHAQAVAEVKKCASLCRYYAENAQDLLADRSVEAGFEKSYVRYLPIGIVFAVMPWNFPFWQVFRFAVPALMAGNVGLLKHASNVPQCAEKIEEIFKVCGFDRGEFQTLMIKSDQVASVIGDERVKAVTLTGSEGAGSSVAELSGEALKKTVLELGGSDPFIVMPSADLNAALDAAVKGRVQNNGQTCVAAKRFIVHEEIYNDFRTGLVERFEALNVGDPRDENTDVGPLATKAIRDELHEQVEDTLRLGAARLCGADVIEGDGNFYQPGILENIPTDSPAYIDELFGPVASLFKVENFDEAITLANDTRFGLGSVIFSQDDSEIERAVNKLEAGCTFINSIVGSHPALPFGGVKASGYGRELAEEGLREFVNIKTIVAA